MEATVVSKTAGTGFQLGLKYKDDRFTILCWIKQMRLKVMKTNPWEGQDNAYQWTSRL